MPKHKVEEEEPTTFVYDPEMDPDLDDIEYDEFSEDDRSKYYQDREKIYDCNAIAVTEYVILTIGITKLVVSSEGKIRKLDDVFSSSIGFTLLGTPYRTYPVEVEKNKIEEYFVHDLVWRAFHGDPPEGWEVRHTYLETKRGNEFYNNALEYLEIYPSTVTYMPATRKYLPDPDL